jgi:MtN3 and saliva related transmembrane protein
MVEIIGFIAAILTTISFIPQALKVIKTNDVKALSLHMYLILNIGIFLWLIYGLLTNSWPLILANGITILFTAFILYKKAQDEFVEK